VPTSHDPDSWYNGLVTAMVSSSGVGPEHGAAVRRGGHVGGGADVAQGDYVPAHRGQRHHAPTGRGDGGTGGVCRRHCQQSWGQAGPFFLSTMMLLVVEDEGVHAVMGLLVVDEKLVRYGEGVGGGGGRRVHPVIGGRGAWLCPMGRGCGCDGGRGVLCGGCDEASVACHGGRDPCWLVPQT
jgi:hypothetical protein